MGVGFVGVAMVGYGVLILIVRMNGYELFVLELEILFSTVIHFFRALTAIHFFQALTAIHW